MNMDEGGDATDIVYRQVDGDALLGRLYRPAGDARVPLLIDVHGGGWIGGDRLNNAIIDRALMQAGIAVFAIDFRMPPVARYPAALEDVAYAIRWIKRHAVRLGIEPTCFGGLGTSSGAHLLLTCLLQPDAHAPADEALRDENGRADFAVAGWPVADPLARYRMAVATGRKNLIAAHDAFWPDEAAMEKANPQLILQRGEAEHVPPLLLLQGTADENVEHERADLFAEHYRARGGDVELHKFPGAPHMFITRDPQADAARVGLAKIVDFVRRRSGLA